MPLSLLWPQLFISFEGIALKVLYYDYIYILKKKASVSILNSKWKFNMCVGIFRLKVKLSWPRTLKEIFFTLKDQKMGRKFGISINKIQSIRKNKNLSWTDLHIHSAGKPKLHDHSIRNSSVSWLLFWATVWSSYQPPRKLWKRGFRKLVQKSDLGSL